MADSERNIKMIISYDGTDYAGFQVQRPQRKKTIQAVLEEALGKITGHPVRIHASGRTDAGVHALAQVISFRTTGRIPVSRMRRAVNGLLPCDIVVNEVSEVPDSFHAQFSALSKTYIYRISCAEVRPAVGYRYCYHYPHELEIGPMEKAGAYFLGEHDFAAFCASRSGAKTTVRTIYQFALKKIADKLYFMITANGFLYQMVRRITGTILEVGAGKKKPEEVSQLLISPDKKGVGRTVPPQGLFLARVYYSRTEKFFQIEDFLDKGFPL